MPVEVGRDVLLNHIWDAQTEFFGGLPYAGARLQPNGAISVI
jgi:hypothetical protein